MCIAFGLQKTKGFVKSFLYKRPLNFWLCLPIFDVYRPIAVQGANRKMAPMIFFFILAKKVA